MDSSQFHRLSGHWHCVTTYKWFIVHSTCALAGRCPVSWARSLFRVKDYAKESSIRRGPIKTSVWTLHPAFRRCNGPRFDSNCAPSSSTYSSFSSAGSRMVGPLKRDSFSNDCVRVYVDMMVSWTDGRTAGRMWLEEYNLIAKRPKRPYKNGADDLPYSGHHAIRNLFAIVDNKCLLRLPCAGLRGWRKQSHEVI